MPAKNKNRRFRDMVKTIIFATNIVVILLLFSSFLSWLVSPLKTNLFSYIGLGFGIILSINILYLCLWILLRKWKLALVSVLAIIVCHKPATTFFPIHFCTPKPPQESVKLLTYNVEGFVNENKKDDRSHPILDYIVNTDADIVLLQEYLVSKTGESLRTQKDVNRILNQYPYRSVVALESSGKYHIYGLACFSKYPIEKSQEIKFNSSFNGAAMYTVNVNGKRIDVVNVHLESNRITAEDKQLYSEFLQNEEHVNLNDITKNIRSRLGRAYRLRTEQTEKVRRFMKENSRGDAQIICGDFNDTPISFAYAQMKKGMKDAFVSTGIGPGITYHEFLFRFRIDYVLHSPDMKAYEARVDKIKYSDHYPVTAYFTFNKTKDEVSR